MGKKKERLLSSPLNASRRLLKFLFIRYGAIPHFTNLSTKETQN